MQRVDLHKDLKPVSWLLGRWVTEEGRGKYPTIKEFEYHDIMEFTAGNQPIMNFSARASHPVKRSPMHQECGFMRLKPGTNEVSLVVSHNFGLTSLEEGIVDPARSEIKLKSRSVTRISFAKSPAVTKFERILKLLAPDTLEVVQYMETENTPMTQHLRAIYKNRPDTSAYIEPCVLQ